MTLPPLAFARPSSLAEATDLLTRPRTRVLAGGQSLVPALAARSERQPPELLVDLGGLPGLAGIDVDGEDRLVIGALARQRTAERSPLVVRHAPLLSQALALVGHPSTRNRGTVVGSLVNADPAAEVPAAAVALDGVVRIAGPGAAVRETPAAELLAGPGRTTLGRGELVTALLIPARPPGERQAWAEFAPRRFDLPLVGVAARLDGAGRARLTFAGVALTPLDVRLDERFDDAALATVAASLDPPEPSGLRRHLARTLGLRALAEAGGG